MTIQIMAQHKAAIQLQILHNSVRLARQIIDEDIRDLLLAQVRDLAETIGVDLSIAATLDVQAAERALGAHVAAWKPRGGESGGAR